MQTQRKGSSEIRERAAYAGDSAQITQAELAEPFRLHLLSEEACCAIRLRMLAGAGVEPGRYTARPSGTPPTLVEGIDAGGILAEDMGPYDPDPPVFATLTAALDNEEASK